VEFRVAASVTHLGVAARLISPALGMAVLLGRVPRMDPAEVYWQPVLGGPLPLSLPASALAGHGDQPGTGQLAGELRRSVLNGPVRALTGVTAAMSVSTCLSRATSWATGVPAQAEATMATPSAAETPMSPVRFLMTLSSLWRR